MSKSVPFTVASVSWPNPGVARISTCRPMCFRFEATISARSLQSSEPQEAVVRLPALELQPDLRRKRAEAVEDPVDTRLPRPAVVRVAREQQVAAPLPVTDEEGPGGGHAVGLHGRGRRRDGAEVRQC